MECGLPISAWLEKKLATPVDPGGGGRGSMWGPKLECENLSWQAFAIRPASQQWARRKAAEVMRLHAQGSSSSDIVKAIGISRASVFRIIAENN